MRTIQVEFSRASAVSNRMAAIIVRSVVATGTGAPDRTNQTIDIEFESCATHGAIKSSQETSDFAIITMIKTRPL